MKPLYQRIGIANFHKVLKIRRAGGGSRFAGISGGRTSGLMACLVAPDVRLLFENTGREHEKTYEFLHELDCRLGGRITWLEYRKPKIKGDRPKNARFEIVNFKTADRSGGPFEAFMETMAEYRHLHKGLPPISPWARGRICTAQMKHKTGERYISTLGIEEFTMSVGLRADEPHRIHGLRNEETSRISFDFPLNELNLSKSDVMQFWSEQDFDLDIQEYQGNCDGCFLKDQSDLSRSLGEMKDPEWWIAMGQRYPMFGGRDFVGYETLLAEHPERVAIETALRNGLIPTQSLIKDPRRFRNVVRQEERRLRGETLGFSCSCEASFNLPEE